MEEPVAQECHDTGYACAGCGRDGEADQLTTDFSRLTAQFLERE
jgi:hypothetical protein